MTIHTELASHWPAYTLLDSGDGYRLEQFGAYTVARPDPNVLWSKHLPESAWVRADATFQRGEGGGWQAKDSQVLEGWKVQFEQATFKVRPTPFRHLGIFPEQAAHWSWLAETISSAPSPKPRILNLFAYTGAASVIAAQSGAQVTHVDASKSSIAWAHENAALSGLPGDAIRWLCDDVVAFLAREARRGNRYDLIILDPPVFGRGPKGQIWRLEEGIVELVQQAASLLSAQPLGFLLNFYATAIYPQALYRAVDEVLAGRFPQLRLGSLCLSERAGETILPTGFFIRS